MTQVMIGHDPSHNPEHVRRVVSLAHRILDGERLRGNNVASQSLETVITLAAILHDINDHKYKKKNNTIIDAYEFLTSHGADHDLAAAVQTVVSNVSYSHEIRNPDQVQALLLRDEGIALAIVQDADRLDAIGAIGIGRTFTFLGARGDHSGDGLESCVYHFGDKLERLQGFMKTETGREMARERTHRLRLFKKWWMDETDQASSFSL